MQHLKNSTKHAAPFGGHCTVRALLLGAAGSGIITTSSMYVALRLGSLPWPTVFVAVMSMAILKLLKHTNLNEINVTHTAMSAGSMVAGGLAFTIPAVWIIDKHAGVNFLTLLSVTLAGSLLGIVFTAFLRPVFIEDRKLPFPIGKAAAETLLAGDAGGSKAKTLFSSMGIAAIFAALRDGFKVIPNAWTWSGLAAKNIFVGFLVSPMACAIGYIIGPLYTGVWFLGAVISHLIIVPVGSSSGWFDDLAAANAFKDSLGIGLMIGTGVGLLLKGVIDRIRRLYNRFLNREMRAGNFSFKYWQLLFLTASFVFTLLTGMGVWAGIITILGVWLTTTMAAAITGQTGINPMEIFGILVLLAARILTGVGGIEALLVSGVAAVACGIAGDVLNDFKSGSILKTDPRAQIMAETVGGIVGAVVSVIALLAMLKAFGEFGPGSELIAPQAYAVSTMVQGLPDAIAFWIGLAIGVGMYILNIPGMTLGLGVFLPMTISASVFLGGIIGQVFKGVLKRIMPGDNFEDRFSLIAAGMLGGEGITGVTIAIIKVLTMT
jgi:uncharacterized oligopeptide transporter (OPT) family protein